MLLALHRTPRVIRIIIGRSLSDVRKVLFSIAGRANPASPKFDGFRIFADLLPQAGDQRKVCVIRQPHLVESHRDGLSAFDVPPRDARAAHTMAACSGRR